MTFSRAFGYPHGGSVSVCRDNGPMDSSLYSHMIHRSDPIGIDEKCVSLDLLSLNEPLVNQQVLATRMPMQPVVPQAIKVLTDDSNTDDSPNSSPELEINHSQAICDLSRWISEPCVIDYLKSKKIVKLFPWQAECLSSPGVFSQGKNLVYSASTSAGKSLVAEILALKHVIERKKKVIIILPFISIVREKLNHLRKMLKGTKYRVGGFMGTHHSKGGLDLYDIAICTNEKANGFINKMLIQNSLDAIGAVIVDEVHSVGECKRGPLLEAMLTKIQVACKLKPSLRIQLIAMSATLPNLNQLARWLNAQMYVTDFRPVPLSQKILICRTIFQVNENFDELEKIESSQLSDENEADVYLVIRSLMRRDPVLLFLNDKKRLERLATKITSRIKSLGFGEGKVAKLIKEIVNESNVKKTIDMFRSCPNKVDRQLFNCVSFGVAYHHGSLCLEHREIIEEAYKAGWIRVLLATSTLAAGVNLPARVVIVASPKFMGRVMDPLMYKQMIGRAGRTGIDDRGESILLCSREEANAGQDLVKMPLLPVVSHMFHPNSKQPWEPLARAVLESIVTKQATTDSEVDYWLSSSYHFASEQPDANLISCYRATAIDYLLKEKFITRRKISDHECYTATHLGSGTVAGSFTPEDGLRLLENLQAARHGLVLTSNLHVLYLIVPLSLIKDFTLDQPELSKLFNAWDPSAIPETVVEVMKALPLSREEILNKMLNGTGLTGDVEKKFIIALVLEEFTRERSIDYIHEKYGIGKPLLQGLQNYAASFAAMVASFCQELKWQSLQLIMNSLVTQLTFGVQPDLIELMEIELLNSKLARALHDDGIDTVRKVAFCSISRLHNVLEPAMEYNSSGRYEIWVEELKQTLSIEQLTVQIQRRARDIIHEFTGAKINWSEAEKNAPSPANKNGPIRKRKKN